jgi:hypothetical protein
MLMRSVLFSINFFPVGCERIPLVEDPLLNTLLSASCYRKGNRFCFMIHPLYPPQHPPALPSFIPQGRLLFILSKFGHVLLWHTPEFSFSQ